MVLMNTRGRCEEFALIVEREFRLNSANKWQVFSYPILAPFCTSVFLPTT